MGNKRNRGHKKAIKRLMMNMRKRKLSRKTNLGNTSAEIEIVPTNKNMVLGSLPIYSMDYKLDKGAVSDKELKLQDSQPVVYHESEGDNKNNIFKTEPDVVYQEFEGDSKYDVVIKTDPDASIYSSSADFSEPSCSFIPEEEYKVLEHEIKIEDVPAETNDPLTGHRVVNLWHVLNWSMSLQQDHAKFCTLGTLHVKNECRNGLISTIVFECDYCHEQISKSTFPRDSMINASLAWSCEHMTDFLAILNVPTSSTNMLHEC